MNLSYIQDGEKVNAAVTNRPISQLAGAVGAINSKINTLAATGARLIATDMPLDPSVSLYNLVYWDALTGKFKKALAALENSGSADTYVAAASSFVQGVVVSRDANTGSLLLTGYYALDNSALAGMMESDVIFVPGKAYYLSRKEFGKLTDKPGVVSVYIGVLGADFISVNFMIKDMAESHLHYKCPLAAQPIGTNVDNLDTTHSIGGFDASTNPSSAKMLVADGVAGGSWTYPSFIDYRFTILAGNTTMLVEKKPDGAASWSTVAAAMPIPTATYTAIDSYGLKVKFAGGPVLTQVWTIRGPRDLMGWAPVDFVNDPSAPVGAKWRYNIEADQLLLGHFPILPTNLPIITENGTELQQGILYNILPVSIYWMSNNENQLPWPTHWVSYSNPGPTEELVYLNIYITKFNIEGESGVVTSLKANLPLQMLDCHTGLPAETGDLLVQFNPTATVITNPPTTGYVVFKGVNSQGQYLAGPVVEKLVVGAGLLATSTLPDGSGGHQGTINIQLASLEQFSGSIADITLQNAKQEILGLTSVTVLEPPPIACGFLGKLRVSTAANAGAKVHMRLMMLGDVAPGADQTVRLKFSWAAVPLGAFIPPVTVSSQFLDFTIPAAYTPVNTLFEKTIVPTTFPGDFVFDIPVNPGDLFCFRIDRLAPVSGTPYSGNLGFASLDFLIS